MSRNFIPPLIFLGALVLTNCSRPNIHQAVMRGDRGRVEELLQQNPQLVNSVNPENGASPLYLAAANNQIAIAQILIAHGAQIDRADKYGTALHVAAENGYVEMMKLLMENGADLNSQQNDWKMTPLHFAATSNQKDAVRFLLASGAQIKVTDIEGRTPLHMAQEKAIIEMLISQGVDINARDHRGWTCLHWAAAPRREYSEESVKLLIDKGANPEIKDKEGKTAVEIARASDKPELAKVIDRVAGRRLTKASS